MAENSEISWCDHTFNPWRGCTKLSPACDHCYAETMSKRNPGVLGVWGKYGTRSIAAESYWNLPLKWNREAEASGQRRRVFCASLADVFESRKTMPAGAERHVIAARWRLLKLIHDTPALDWLLLTKRPDLAPYLIEEAAKTVPGGDDGDTTQDHYINWCVLWLYGGKPPANVWIGTTVENQKYADLRLPQLLKVPAVVHFVSMEPLLGPVELWGDDGEGLLRGPGVVVSGGMTPSTPDSPPEGYDDSYPGIDWVIVGGESGPKARPTHPDWFRSIRDQCVAHGVAFHFKQWGAWHPDHVFDNIRARGVAMKVDGSTPSIDDMKEMLKGPSEWFEEQHLSFVGKKKAGRLLDGREWNEMPEVQHVPN